jgi:hypothetical protein
MSVFNPDKGEAYNQIEYEENKLIYERDLVPIGINWVNYFVWCATCGTYFCHLRGKETLHTSQWKVSSRLNIKRN